MPYWKRREALNRNLATYRDLYPDDLIEVIVVDDGSPEPAEVENAYPWPVTVIRLPDKDHALNPCTAINRGVAAASGEYILLTNPEVIHRGPILAGLLAEVIADHNVYAAAACWGGAWWYCHSTDMPPPEKVGRAPYPKGAGLHFCSMLHRDLWASAGGFDEAYRDGAGYEDNDFLWRLAHAGARFVIRDDLVTDHIACARSKWPAGGFDRNRALFEDRWRGHIS